MEIVSIINQKGGVGKSTTAASLGHGLIMKGFRVLFIDLDAQGNLTSTFDLDEETIDAHNSVEMLSKRATVEKSIVKSSYADIIPYSPLLANIDSILTDAVGKDKRLDRVLRSSAVYDEYDYIVMDTPPSLSILTINALTASDSIVIPAQADMFSVQGIDQLFDTVSAIWEYNNPKLVIKGILITRYNPRTILSRQVASFLEEKAKAAGTFVYESRIRECTAIKESQIRCSPIYAYDKRSNASIDYMNFVDEFLKA